jgi:hypothetical protein
MGELAMKILKTMDHNGKAVYLIPGKDCKQCVFKVSYWGVNPGKCICHDELYICKKLGGVWSFDKPEGDI